MAAINRLLMQRINAAGATVKSAVPIRVLRVAYVTNGIALMSLFITWLVLLLNEQMELGRANPPAESSIYLTKCAINYSAKAASASANSPSAP